MLLTVRVRAAALSLTCLLGASAASAQDRPPPPSQPPLPYLLHLRPEQAAAWRAYRDELALERASAARSRAEVEQLNALTTPQRLDRTLAELPQREADARRAADATRAFYAALLPDQRKIFDDVTQVRLPPAPAAPPAGRSPPSSGAGARLPTPPQGVDRLPPPASESPAR